MTRATKLSAIVSCALGAIVLAFALIAADWSSRDDLLASLLFTAILAITTFGITFVSLRAAERNRRSREMTKGSDKPGTIGVVFLVAVLGYGMYAIDWSFLRGHITDYTLKCTSNVSSDNRCGSYVQGPVTVYAGNVDRQFVVSQTDGGPPSKMSKCAIVDRKNWKCNAPDGNDVSAVVFTNGEYEGVVVPPFYKHVSRVEWLRANKGSK